MIRVHTYTHMVRYEIRQGDLSIGVLQCREHGGGPWKTMMSSVLRFGCGMAGDKLDPFEMLAELFALTSELRTVIFVLDNAQRIMGDEYDPPLIPFKDEYLPDFLSLRDMDAAIRDLYIALQERNDCNDCGGRGWHYVSDQDGFEKEPCQCATNADEVLARRRKAFEAASNQPNKPEE